MKHKLRVSVSKDPQTAGVVTCKSVKLRERIMKRFFGDKKRVTILIPGDSVNEVDICETEKGEANG